MNNNVSEFKKRTKVEKVDMARYEEIVKETKERQRKSMAQMTPEQMKKRAMLKSAEYGGRTATKEDEER